MSETRKRKVLSLEQKLEVIKKVDKNESVKKVALEYDVGVQTVRDIFKNKGKLEKFVQNTDTARALKNRKTMKGSSYDQLDNTMIKWFQQKRAEGVPISGPMCMHQANFFFKKLRLEGTFNASTGWLRRFKDRHGIRELQIQGEQLSSDITAATVFTNDLEKLVSENGLVREQIYNADETGLYWRTMPTKTLASAKEKRAPGYKISKDRITVLCCANATGEDKLPLAVIGKSKSPRALKNLMNTLPVTYYNHPTAWITRDLFKKWFSEIFVPHVKKYMAQKGLPLKAVLILDNAPSHPPAEQLTAENNGIFVYFLPPNVTALVQPMDQGVIENMKRIYRKNLMIQLITNEDQDSVKFWKSLNIKEAIFSIADAWRDVKKETIRRAFRKMFNESDDDVLIPGTGDTEINPEELAIQLQEIQGCEEVDSQNVTEWLDIDKEECGYKLLSDDELIASCSASVSQCSSGFDAESESDCEEENEALEVVSTKKAIAAAETLLSYFEQQGSDYTDILHMRRYVMVLKRKEWDNMKQTKITNFFSKS